VSNTIAVIWYDGQANDALNRLSDRVWELSQTFVNYALSNTHQRDFVAKVLSVLSSPHLDLCN
jgi:hypothetical protein